MTVLSKTCQGVIWCTGQRMLTMITMRINDKYGVFGRSEPTTERRSLGHLEEDGMPRVRSRSTRNILGNWIITELRAQRFNNSISHVTRS
jgi:hypothetical protein